MDAERTGVLVMRVWTEPGRPELRARLIETDGVDGGETTVAAAGIDAICDAVRAWLEPLAAAALGRDAGVTHG